MGRRRAQPIEIDAQRLQQIGVMLDKGDEIVIEEVAKSMRRMVNKGERAAKAIIRAEAYHTGELHERVRKWGPVIEKDKKGTGVRAVAGVTTRTRESDSDAEHDRVMAGEIDSAAASGRRTRRAVKTNVVEFGLQRPGLAGMEPRPGVFFMKKSRAYMSRHVGRSIYNAQKRAVAKLDKIGRAGG